MKIPKYAIPENERRWTCREEIFDRIQGQTHKVIVDRYFAVGRLRLRSMFDSKTGITEFKLCKKYGASGISEPIVNVYLTEEEHSSLKNIEAHELSKMRYKLIEDNLEFSIDVFIGKPCELIICEIEMDDIQVLQSIRKPSFAIKEVTELPFFKGSSLSRASNADIAREILDSRC